MLGLGRKGDSALSDKLGLYRDCENDIWDDWKYGVGVTEIYYAVNREWRSDS